MSSLWARTSPEMRSLTALRSTPMRDGSGERPSMSTPRLALDAAAVMALAVATRVLLGTQSVRTADPPGPSRSTRVTSAPSWRATSAAS